MNKTRGHIHNHGKEYNQIEATPGSAEAPGSAAKIYEAPHVLRGGRARPIGGASRMG